MQSFIIPFELKALFKRYLKNNNIKYEYIKEPVLSDDDIKRTKELLSSLNFKGSFDKMSIIKAELSYDDYVDIIKAQIDKNNNVKHELNYEQKGILFVDRNITL